AVTGERDQLHAHALDDRKDNQDLVGFAGIGNREHQVLRHDHAEVAVRRFAGMHEKGRRAGGGERGGNLAADVAGLAHADDHDAALGLQDKLAAAVKALIDVLDQRLQCLCFDLERFAPELLEGHLLVVHASAFAAVWHNSERITDAIYYP